jgi:hypothetical protein
MFNKSISGSANNYPHAQEKIIQEQFTNVETWNLVLWFEFNAPMKKIVRATSYYLGGGEIKRWCYKLWEGGKTPDGIPLSKVEWDEIHNLWSTESKRIFKETQKALDYRVFKEWNEC